jgi:hypothetical protein
MDTKEGLNVGCSGCRRGLSEEEKERGEDEQGGGGAAG